MNQKYLRPTDFADLKYCHRLYYFNNIHPHNGKTTELTALGKFEHAVFEKYYDLTKLDWIEAGQLNGKEKDSHKSRTSLILDTELKIAKENFPLFADFFEKDLTTLWFRLSKLNHQKIDHMNRLLKNKLSFENAIDIVLPWKIEQWFQSDTYGIRGIADIIYKTEDDSMIIEDIKSHSDRYDAFIHRDAHEAQGVTYAILAEEKYGKPVKKFQIFYSQDISTEVFKITKKSKLKILDAIDESKEVLDNGLPPRLEGDAAVKCQNCYKRDFCFSLDKKSKPMELIA